MISKQKLYKYNPNSLQFSEEKIPAGKKIANGIKFIGIASVLALLIIAVFHFTVGSPWENILQKRIETAKTNYQEINTTLDSISETLHHDLFASDNFHRQVLDMDSLPEPIRIAGTGGSNPYDSLKNLKNEILISSTLQKIDILKNQLKVQEESSYLVYKKAIHFNREKTEVPTIQPVTPRENIWISSNFGARSDPFTHNTKYHKGIDLVGPRNTNIYATADGVVTLAKDSRTGYGKEVVITHSYGYSTRYAHLNKILVKEGKKVKRGELVGLMGSTGRSTGTHLHYEVRLNNRPINPRYFYADDLTEQEYEQITKLTTKGTDKNDKTQL